MGNNKHLQDEKLVNTSTASSVPQRSLPKARRTCHQGVDLAYTNVNLNTGNSLSIYSSFYFFWFK